MSWRSRANAIQAPARESFELFNIADDPGEKDDRSKAEPERLAAMRKRLEALRAAGAPPHLLPNRAPEGFRVPKVWGQR